MKIRGLLIMLFKRLLDTSTAIYYLLVVKRNVPYVIIYGEILHTD